MYIPESFEEKDLEKIFQLVEKYSFATVITSPKAIPLATHLPLMVEREGSNIRLIGHMARANEQWRHFLEQGEILVIFHGPHCYISPSNYFKLDAPTWNYAAVHMYGSATIIEEEKKLVELVESLAKKYESSRSNPVEPGYSDRLIQYIVGFTIKVSRVEAKFKMSQNRSDAERQNVICNLAKSEDDNERSVAQLMKG